MGCQPQKWGRQPIILANFPQTLHKNEQMICCQLLVDKKTHSILPAPELLLWFFFPNQFTHHLRYWLFQKYIYYLVNECGLYFHKFYSRFRQTSTVHSSNFQGVVWLLDRFQQVSVLHFSWRSYSYLKRRWFAFITDRIRYLVVCVC